MTKHDRLWGFTSTFVYDKHRLLCYIDLQLGPINVTTEVTNTYHIIGAPDFFLFFCPAAEELMSTFQDNYGVSSFTYPTKTEQSCK